MKKNDKAENSLQIQRTTYSVGDFIGWQRDRTLLLNPNFQRRSVWQPGQKSYFIDTIIRGFPIPIIFLRDLGADLKTFQPKRDVVDGQQRLRTLITFIAPDTVSDIDSTRDSFLLKKEHNSQFGDSSFASLPSGIRQRILDYQFSVQVFSADTSDAQVIEIFARMNSSGYKLNPQELRNAKFFGPFKTLAVRLASAQIIRWRKWHIFSPQSIARMDEVETTSELMILILRGVSEKNERVIEGQYELFDKKFADEHEVAARFEQVFATIESQFNMESERTFKKRTMFYALFASIYDLHYGLRSPLTAGTPSPIEKKAMTSIRNRAAAIIDGSAPQEVLLATTARPSHAISRAKVTGYLLNRKIEWRVKS